MATAVQVESLWNGLTDNSGQPLAAGRVFTYAAGTTTPVSLFTASDKSTSATNPIILDANGKAQVWADGRYKFEIRTAANAVLYTLDNLLYGFDDTTVLYGGTSTGAANAQVVSVPATVTSYANGQTVSFIAGFTNTGATTLQFNSLSAVNLVKGPTPSSLQAGDLIAGQLYTATYHGGAFRLTDFPTVADVQRGRYQLASSVAGTNTITANLTPAPSSYETGMVVLLTAANANTGATTLNLNSLGAKTIQRQGTALVGAEFKAGDVIALFYDGTQFQLLNVPSAPLFVDRTNNRVGIGTTSPTDLLEIASTGTTPQIWTVYPGASASGANLTIRKSRGSAIGTNTIVANNDTIGQIEFQGANGTTFTPCAAIAVEVDGSPGASNDMPGRLVFLTTTDATGTLAARMRIDNAGRIGIQDAPFASAQLYVRAQTTSRVTARFYQAVSGDTGTPALNLDKFDNNSTTSQIFLQATINQQSAGQGQINANGASQLAFGSYSDKRLKENIADLPSQLHSILALRPVEFDYKNGSGHQIGFIAQEVQAVYPDLVAVGKDEMLTLSGLGKWESRLIKAIQELNAKVEALEARVAELEA